MTSADDTAGCPTQRPASADYVTTTGERWHINAFRSEGMNATLLVGVAEGASMVRASEILAELRALRAQRDELLAALRRVHNQLRDDRIWSVWDRHRDSWALLRQVAPPDKVTPLAKGES